MSKVLGIETSCDETAAAVFDTEKKQLLSSSVFSQVSLHEQYGGVVPEIASRSHVEKINGIVQNALDQAKCTLDDIDSIAVTTKPGLAGSLLVGLSFAKGLAWAKNKKIIGINHLEGHLFSSFLNSDGSVREDINFPHICFTVSGGHTALYLVKGFGEFELLGQTLDDAAGEAFDKVAKLLGLGYPGGPFIEKYAKTAGFEDYFKYPRTKNKSKSFDFSFSGLKTAVLYDLVKRGAFDLKAGVKTKLLDEEMQQKVASSFLACVADVFKSKLKFCFNEYPEIQGATFVGGVACNQYLREILKDYCDGREKYFVVPPVKFCGDNAAMIAFVGGYKHEKGEFDSLELDILNK
jgi:N6-L-threonylcarbamoyladenine synthase